MSLTTYFEANPSAKRHIWLISLSYPLMPLMAVGLMLATGNPYMSWAPVVMIYLIMPIIEHLMGDDDNDLLGLREEEHELSPFYRFMVHALLPIIYGTWLIGAWYAATQSLPAMAYIGLAISHGWGLAYAINSGHETGHKTDKVSKWIALFMLVPGFYGHFRVEHNQGHHSDVATPRDHATARFGEGYWAFIVREYPGAWKRSWKLESKRASRRGYSRFSLKNEVVMATAMSVFLWTAVILWLGWIVVPYLIIATAISASALSSQNYYAHYGLLRETRPDGKYLPCMPHHSWNSNKLFTNMISYNLARHSDHHAHPSRHYQHLRNFKEVPVLPYGYGTMTLLAYFPPLFRRVMDPLVLANVDGDMSKVLTKELAKLAN